jgi:hypothetical protein
LLPMLVVQEIYLISSARLAKVLTK